MGNFPSIPRHGDHRPARHLDPAASPASHPIDLNDLDQADQGQPEPRPDPAPPQQAPGPPVQNAALQGIVAGMAPASGEAAEGVESGQAHDAENMPLHRLILRGQLQAMQARLDALPDDNGNALLELLAERDPNGDTPLHLALMPGPVDPEGAMLGRLLENIPDEHVVELLSLRDGLGSNVLQAAIQQSRPDAFLACLNEIPDAKLSDFLTQPVFPPPGADHLLTSGTLLHQMVRHDMADSVAHTTILMARVNALQPAQIREILETRDDEGQMALHLAARRGDLPALKAMIDGHENRAGIINDRGRTPMHDAAEAGQAHVVRLLLARNQARGDAKDAGGRTPLHLAAAEGRAETIATLMENRPDRADVHENGPLSTADRELNRHGNHPQIEGGSQNTPLHEAAKNGNVDAVHALLNANADGINQPNRHRETALHLAAQCGNAGIVDALLAKNVDGINLEDWLGRTALYFAVEGGRLDIVNALLAKNADVISQTDVAPQTLLHLAARYGYTEIVRVLWTKNPDAAIAQNRSGNIAMHEAAQQGYVDVVHAFLHPPEEIADKVNVADLAVRQGTEGLTPLHHAAKNGHLAVVEELIDDAPERALRLAEQLADARPADLARENGHIKIAEVLDQAVLSLSQAHQR